VYPMEVEMADRSFQAGFVKYKTGLKTADEAGALIDNPKCKWTDGYLTFSKGELPLKSLPTGPLSAMIAGTVPGIKDRKGEDIQGYLMEVDLWCKRDGCYKEISLERDDAVFYLQKWELAPDPIDGAQICYWREVDILPHAKSTVFAADIKALEVIVPERRLHFFLTAGGTKP
jgi:hypothetical protein